MSAARYPDPLVLRPDTLFSSVGTCGANPPQEVRKLQQMIVHAGYLLATGRRLDINGNCDSQTIEAIRWYQRLLNLSPSGIVSPLDNWFLTALGKMSTPLPTARTPGPLHVRQGQITFDAEGHDYITAIPPFRKRRTPYFSRVLQWPGGNSGVTLGRGYDMGNRSRGEVFATLRRAGIEEYQAVICSKAAGLKGNQAKQFVTVFGPMVGEISHQQQIALFEAAYREKSRYAEGVYNRNSATVKEPLQWSNIDEKIKEVFIDTLYQGNASAKKMVVLMAENNDMEKIINYLQTDPYQGNSQRNRARMSHLK